ncbi:MAG: DMT family protein [Planctomycetes bacterium]|nr:DMT family protein [Planctomycetota bacterium]
MKTVLLLCASNLFMTTAWYGHLKFKGAPILAVIFVSWLIALPEYALQVPANRWGHGQFTAPQLKLIQEAISITVFVGFSIFVLREWPRWTDGLGLVLVFAGLAVTLFGRPAIFLHGR